MDSASIRAKVAQAARDLEEHGWAVIPDVLAPALATSILNDVWATLEAVSRGRVQRANPSTWRGQDFFKTMKGILMEPSNIYHAAPVWRARQEVAPYFAHLYGDANLGTSFDRINIFPAPSAVGGRVQRVGPWLHTDQTPLRNGRLCVQGFIDFLGTGADDAGLIVADKSHLQHHDLLYKTWRIKEAKNWYKFTDDQRAYIEAHFELKKVHCPPRSLVLWDSRTFHQNTPPLANGHERFVIYVCMQPWAHLGSAKKIEAAKAKKRQAYAGQRGTSHWPLFNTLFSRFARSFGQPIPDYKTDAATIQQPALDDPAHWRIAAMVGHTDGACVAKESFSAGEKPLLATHPELLLLNKKALLKLLGDKNDDDDDDSAKEEEERPQKRARKED